MTTWESKTHLQKAGYYITGQGKQRQKEIKSVLATPWLGQARISVLIPPLQV